MASLRSAVLATAAEWLISQMPEADNVTPEQRVQVEQGLAGAIETDESCDDSPIHCFGAEIECDWPRHLREAIRTANLSDLAGDADAKSSVELKNHSGGPLEPSDLGLDAFPRSSRQNSASASGLLRRRLEAACDLCHDGSRRPHIHRPVPLRPLHFAPPQKPLRWIPPPSRDSSSTRWMPWAIVAGLLLAIALIYGQTLWFDFLGYDDQLFITQCRPVREGLTTEGIRWALTDGPAGNWYPLAMLSHMLDCQLYGLDHPAGHFLGNLLLHAGTVVGLFFVLRAMTGQMWPSALVAALLAAHPQHVESVAWLAERRDVLSGFLFVLTLAAYLGYVRHDRSLGRYLLRLLALALGLMAKAMLVTLPALLLLLDYWPLGRFGDADDDAVRSRRRMPSSAGGRRTNRRTTPIWCVEDAPYRISRGAVCLGSSWKNCRCWPWPWSIRPSPWPVSRRCRPGRGRKGSPTRPSRWSLIWCIVFTRLTWPRSIPTPPLANRLEKWPARSGCSSRSARLSLGPPPVSLPVCRLVLVARHVAAGAGIDPSFDARHGRSLHVSAGDRDLHRRGVECLAAMPDRPFGCGCWPRRRRWCSWRSRLCRAASQILEQSGDAVEPRRGSNGPDRRNRDGLGRGDAEQGPAGRSGRALSAGPGDRRRSHGAERLRPGPVRLRRYDEAAAAYRRGLELLPTSARLLANLGGVLLEQGHPDEAMPNLLRAIQEEPSLLPPYLIMVRLLADQGRYDDALVYCRQALSVDPSHARACPAIAFRAGESPGRAAAMNGARYRTRSHRCGDAGTANGATAGGEFQSTVSVARRSCEFRACSQVISWPV